MSLFGKKSEQEFMDGDHPGSKPRLRATYGIEEAIVLMRTLPVEQNPDLVVLVLKNTLQSMNVNLKDIIRDAVAKEQAVGHEIAEMKQAITELEQEVAEKRQIVAEKEAELAEVTHVKERLDSAVAHDEVTVPLMAESGAVIPGAAPPGST